MRTKTTITTIGLALMLLSGCGRQPESARADDAGPSHRQPGANAADTYHAVYTALGEPLLEQIKNDQASHAALAAQSADLDLLTEATRSPTCDFRVDFAQGMDAKLGHLPELRGLARALRADAERLLREGDADGAARRTAAILRMSAHLAREGRLAMELLTASAIAALGCEFVVQNPQLADAPWTTDIQNALADLKKDGTLRSLAIVRSEGELSARWLREGKALDLSGVGGQNWRAKSQAERDRAADGLLALTAAAAEAWPAPDAVTRLDAIVARGRPEEGAEFALNFARIRSSVDNLNVLIAEADATLR